ncbi:hypothetical protein [Streptococcus suis]
MLGTVAVASRRRKAK